MKNIKKIILLLFFLASYSSAQVIISPYIVYMDEQNKYGSMIVQNESLEPYEISISFIFGYPISDSLGNRTMNYVQKPNADMPSIDSWIKAFPKKFVLNPKERQTVRIMIKPPLGIAPGTYWTRLVTSSTPVDTDQDSTINGVNAKLKFVLNQVTTAIYRKNDAFTGLKVDTPSLFLDSTNTYQILYPLKREGNTPFFGYLNLKVFDENGAVIKEERDYLSVYFDIIRNYVLATDLFKKGIYNAELTVEFNEKEDIPESKLNKPDNIIHNFKFSIP